MNLVKWNKVYDQNKYLDDIFKDKYKNDDKLVEKNGIELLVEIGEFINETKVFKYWTTKSPNKYKILEEYADVITMILTFYHEFNFNIKDLNIEKDEKDLLKLFKDTYKLTLDFINNNLETNLDNLFSNILDIGKILEFKEDDILNSIEKKQKIIEERLNSNY